MLRAYYFEYDVDFGGIAVIAANMKQARRLLWEDPDVRECCDGEWINMDIRRLKDADTDGLNIGDVPDGIDAIRRNIYGWAEDDCPICGKLGTLSRHYEEDGPICCSDCDEKLYQEWLQKREASGEISRQD